MGFFDVKWIVEFEYSEGFLSSIKKATIVVEASSEYSAKDKAKSVLRSQYKYVKVLSARKSTGKADERNATNKDFVSVEPKKVTTYTSSVSSYSEPVREYTSEEKQRIRELKQERVRLQKEEAKARELRIKYNKIKRIQRSPLMAGLIGSIATLFAFLLGWIPYWVNNARLKFYREEILWREEMGYSPEDESVQFLFEEGLKAKEMRDSSIPVPFILLGIGIVIVVVLVVILYKSRDKRKKVICDEINKLIEKKE